METQFALAYWTWKDIQDRKPDWDQDTCENFLDSNEDEIADRMIEAGWSIIDYLLNQEENELE